MLDSFRECVYGFSFATFFSTLAAQIWFFPLDFMDVTGYEVVILFAFSPILLLWKPLLSIAKHQILFLVSCVFFSIAFAQTGLVPRTIYLGIATGICNLVYAARIRHNGQVMFFFVI
jgi:PGAP2IP, first transmembrane domain